MARPRPTRRSYPPVGLPSWGRLAALGVTLLAAFAVSLAPSGAASAPMEANARAVSLLLGAPGLPRFDTYVGPATLPNVDNAGEPSIGLNWATDHAFFQASASTYRISWSDDATGNASSAPAATWDNVSPAFTAINIDPILFVDPTEHRILAGGLDGGCSILGISDDDGATWLPAANPCSGAHFDHETVGLGAPAAAGLGTAGGLAFPHVGYYCGQDGVDGLPYSIACATSLDGGRTFGPPVVVGGACHNQHGHVRVNPVDGFAAVPHSHCGGHIGFIYTPDGGLTWNSRAMPDSQEADGFDPSLAFSTHGWLYLAAANADGVHVGLSRDNGATWETLGTNQPDLTAGKWLGLNDAYLDPHNGNPIQMAVFPNVAAGDDDRVAITFMGSTQTGVTNPFSSCGGDSEGAVWHYYMAQSLDAGQSWSVARLSEDPVQVGGIWLGQNPAGDDCRNLLDFQGMGIDSKGRVVVGFADGCLKQCAADYDAWVSGTGARPADTASRGSHATILRQSTGPTLFAAQDRAAPAAPPSTGPEPTPSAKSPGAGAALALLALATGLALVARRKA